jgi:hypothetical protein
MMLETNIGIIEKGFEDICLDTKQAHTMLDSFGYGPKMQRIDSLERKGNIIKGSFIVTPEMCSNNFLLPTEIVEATAQTCLLDQASQREVAGIPLFEGIESFKFRSLVHEGQIVTIAIDKEKDVLVRNSVISKSEVSLENGDLVAEGRIRGTTMKKDVFDWIVKKARNNIECKVPQFSLQNNRSDYEYYSKEQINDLLKNITKKIFVDAFYFNPNSGDGVGVFEISPEVCDGHNGVFRGVDQIQGILQSRYLLNKLLSKDKIKSIPFLKSIEEFAFVSPAIQRAIINYNVRNRSEEMKDNTNILKDTVSFADKIITEGRIEMEY